jgi:hypothetical protein
MRRGSQCPSMLRTNCSHAVKQAAEECRLQSSSSTQRRRRRYIEEEEDDEDAEKNADTMAAMFSVLCVL